MSNQPFSIPRDLLAQALAALQSEPSASLEKVQLAASVADAIHELTELEKSGPTSSARGMQLVQTLFDVLNRYPTPDPSVSSAIAAVAHALGTLQTPPSAKPSSSKTPPSSDVSRPFEASLGTHSVTNFYKGLGGNDVLEHGGLFISTYRIPKLGSEVHLKVSLPGGYEFEAVGIVRWRRDSTGGIDEPPPGFGVRFTQISPEAKQLVYRYVKNREPLFHDD